MLKDDLYTITNLLHDGNTINATLVLNAAHKIFEGHFPGQPVVPGVCTMQIVREILETALQLQLQFVRAGSIKFISLIDPVVNPVVDMQLNYKFFEHKITVNAMALVQGVVCFKFMGEYR